MWKFFTLILIAYLLYRYVMQPQRKIPPPQEPDIFIEHEEIKSKDEKNK